MKAPGRAGALCLLLVLSGCGWFGSSTPPTRGGYKVGNPYQIAGVWYYPREDFSYDETGIASWYGPGFHARATANGETFDQNALTAAHNTLQMPAIVRVTNLENGRQVVLRVNDRGPFANGRILDVSRRSAELLGFIRSGTARVRVQVLETESRQAALQAQNRGGGAPPIQMAAAPRDTVSSDALSPPPGVRQSGAVRQAVATRTSGADALAVSDDGAPARLPETVTRVAAHPGNIYVQLGAFQQRANAERLRGRLGQFHPQVTQMFADGQNLYRVRVGPLENVQVADATLNRIFRSGVSEARIVVE